MRGKSLQGNSIQGIVAVLIAALSVCAAPSTLDPGSPVDEPLSTAPLDTTAFTPDPSVYQDIEAPQEESGSPKIAVRSKISHPPRISPKAKHPPKAKPGRSHPVQIPSGCFWMGSPDGTGAANEHPRHRVCLDSFRMDPLPVTQKEFTRATGQSPWTLCAGPACAGPDRRSPAWFVTWTEADDFCHARGGRLPTEAEFEYAARAGDSGIYIWGDTVSQACWYANFADLSLKKILPSWNAFPCDDGEPLVAPAGKRLPNRWGLFDMAGNVWEWTADWYAADAYAKSSPRNPTGPDSGSGRVIRGGSWLSSPDGGRASYRDGFQPEGRYTGAIGFRCVYPSH